MTFRPHRKYHRPSSMSSTESPKLLRVEAHQMNPVGGGAPRWPDLPPG